MIRGTFYGNEIIQRSFLIHESHLRAIQNLRVIENFSSSIPGEIEPLPVHFNFWIAHPTAHARTDWKRKFSYVTRKHFDLVEEMTEVQI